jgi:Ca-activated chloride channel family protein
MMRSQLPGLQMAGLSLATMFFCVTWASAQFPPPPPDPNDLKITTHVEMVLLDVSVKGKEGGFVSDLQKDNFQIRENGKVQTVASFNSKDIPVTVCLVMDNSLSMRAKRPEVVTAALTFVKESHPQDEMCVVNFNDTVSMGLPEGTEFTDDVPVLRNALLKNPVQGRTALYDAIEVAMNQLEKGRRDKKTLVVISDGGDNASDHKIDDVLHRLEENSVTVYTVGIYSPGDKDANPGVLKRIANLTGGLYFFPEKLDDLVAVCTKIAKDIRNRYTIGYVPDDRNFDGKLRKISVTATGESGAKLAVRTRASYLARTRKDVAPPATTASTPPSTQR